MPTNPPTLPCPSCACPYDWRTLYAALSLDAKARLAARHLAETHGCPPNGPQVVARLRELDGRDRIDRKSAWRAANTERDRLRIQKAARK